MPGCSIQYLLVQKHQQEGSWSCFNLAKLSDEFGFGLVYFLKIPVTCLRHTSDDILGKRKILCSLRSTKNTKTLFLGFRGNSQGNEATGPLSVAEKYIPKWGIKILKTRLHKIGRRILEWLNCRKTSDRHANYLFYERDTDLEKYLRDV